MLRLKLAWFVVAIAMIVGGGQMFHDGLNNGSTPTEVTIGDLSQKKPTATWLKVTKGVLFVPLVTWMENTKTHQIDELFIPIVPAEEGGDFKQVHVLLRTKRQDLIARVREMRTMDKAPEAVAIEYLQKNADKLLVAEDFQGMIEWGINSSSETRSSIGKINKDLASDYMILRDREEPQGGPGLALLVLGGAMLVGGGAYLLGVFDKKKGPIKEKVSAMREPRTRPRDEPKVIEVDADFAKELGLENAQGANAPAADDSGDEKAASESDASSEEEPAAPKVTARPAAKPETKRVVVAKKPASAPTVKAVPSAKRPTSAIKPALAKPAAKPAGDEAADDKPSAEKQKPLMARKKRILPS